MRWGKRLHQGAEDGVGDALDGRRPAAHRGGRPRIDEAPFGQHGVDGAEAAAVVRDGGIGHRADGVVHGGERRGGHGIEGAAHLGTRAGEVERHGRAPDFHRHLDLHGPIVDPVVVEPVGEGVGPVGNGLDLPAGERLRAGEQLVDVGQHRGGAVAGEQLAQARAAQPPRRDLRHEVAREGVGEPHVAPEETEQVLVERPRAEELRRRDDDALLEQLRGVGGDAARGAAAHVLVVAHGAGEGHRAPLGEHRHGQGDVGKMGAAVVRIVQEEGVAVLHGRRREGLHQPLGRELQRAEVDGDGGGLRDGLALRR